MKKLFIIIFAVLIAQPVYAQNWIINRHGDEVEVRRQYDYNPSNKYRGYIDTDGYTRLRNYQGDTVRGYIDNDGYGRLRDNEGNTYRMRPRW